MDFEDILSTIDGWGFYQKRLWFLLAVLLEIFNEINLKFMMFAAVAPEWYCASDRGEASLFRLLVNSSFSNNSSVSSGSTCSSMDTCTNYKFAENVSTIVTDFLLYCDRKYVGEIVTAAQMAGVLIGALVYGQLAELFGRKKVLIFIVLSEIVFGIGISFVPNWQLFAFNIFLLGTSCGGFLCVNFVTIQEQISSSKRLIAASLTGWPIGILVYCLLFWYFHNWRTVLLIVNSCAILSLLNFIWITDSPRWLCQHGKWEKAHEAISYIAKVNGKTAPNQESLHKPTFKKRNYSYHNLFITNTLRKRTAALAFGWFTVSFTSYGLSFNVKNLHGDRYTNTVIMTLLSAFTMFGVAFASNWFGRRFLNLSSLVFTGLCLLLVTVLKSIELGSEYEWVVTGLALLGASALSPSWIIVYLYSAELFPTVVRNLSNGLCSIVARIGGILAPLLLLTAHVWPTLPYLVFTVVLVINIALAYFILPETRGQPLADALPEKPKPKDTKVVASVT